MPYQFSNVEIKILPNGDKVVRKVYMKNGSGYKSVTKYGIRKGKGRGKGKRTLRRISYVKKPIHDDHVERIQTRTFVPGLFADCILDNPGA